METVGTPKIETLPSASPRVARKLVEQAQELKASDPAQAVELQEKVIRILVKEIRTRNETIRALQKLLLDYLPDD